MTRPTNEDRLRSSLIERVCTVLLLVGLGCTAVLASFLGLFFSMASDGCGGGEACNADQIGLGVGIAAISPIVVFAVAVVQVVKRFRQGRRAWWVPLVALVVGVVLFAVGGIVAGSAAS